MGDVEALEAEARIGRGDRLGAPQDAAHHRIDAVIAALSGVEILRQGHGHAADAAADVEDALMRLEPADADEMAEEFGADGAIIAIPDEDRIRWRMRHEAVALQRGQQPVEL